MKIVLFSLVVIFNSAFSTLELNLPDHRKVFSNQFFEDVLDHELCEEQLAFLSNNTMLYAQFLDAGVRIPKGLLQLNLNDFGNYYQCLDINEEFPEWTIQGKHCAFTLPFAQNLSLPELPTWPQLPDNIRRPELLWPGLNPEASRISKETLESIWRARSINRASPDSPLAELGFQLAVCVPKPCTPKQFLDSMVNLSIFGVQYDEMYCRLPDDKQWVAGEYIAIAIFAFLGLLVILSTGYDLLQTIILHNDPKKLSKLYLSFSIYTNTRRLVTYTPVPGTIECLDGIRAFAMMWVIVGHTYVNQLTFPVSNILDIFDWIPSVNAIWITLAPITVDTFFMIGGLVLVYTTAAKFPRWKLLKTLHLFYLNRLLRMFPVLAAFILIEVSFLNRLADGPHWVLVQDQTENCRQFWWSALLHVQNWVNPHNMCLAVTWYLAIDVQLYILSPIVLIWVLGCKKTSAWTALIGSFLLVLAGSTVYCFLNDFASWPASFARTEEETSKYYEFYYVNTLTRASPFFVGMIYGYLMHLYRGQEVVLSKIVVALLWACAVLICAGITYTCYLLMQLDWDNQIADNFVNSFIRPAWAIAIGWMVFACHHGYGGPINWVLSLRAWKVLSRLSYAMYITHNSMIVFVYSTAIAPGYFSSASSVFKFISFFGLAVVVSFILTLLVDSPFSTLMKLAMGGGQRRPRPLVNEEKDKSKDSPIGIENKAFEGDSSGKVQR